MLTREEFHEKIRGGIHFLDGATGSNLRLSGMPNGCCTEEWVLNHPEVLVKLQRAYAEAGSQILYAPTFQAQPLALASVGLENMTESINAQLVALSRSAAPGCLIAGDLTTLAAFCESWNPDNFDLLVENYQRQIRGLMDGGCDILVAETLMYPQEAEAILCAADMEGAGACMFSFTMTGDGSLFSGPEAGPILRDLEEAGAAALGFNCVAMDMMTPYLVAKLRRYVRGPLLCKPNAGSPMIDETGTARYSMDPEQFAAFALQCRRNGADLLGGCCGTDPQFLARLTQVVKY